MSRGIERARKRGLEVFIERTKVPGFRPQMIWHPFLDMPVPCTDKFDTLWCPYPNCKNNAGQGTLHPGVGACSVHSRSKYEKVAGAFLMAHAIAKALDISPWEALLLPIRRAAAWAAFYEMKLSEVENDDDLRPGGAAHDWLLAAERVNTYMVRWSKMAIDAGISRILVEQAQTSGAQIAMVLNQAIADSGIDGITEIQLRQALRKALENMASKDAVREMPPINALSTSEPEVNPDDRWKDDRRWYGGSDPHDDNGNGHYPSGE